MKKLDDKKKILAVFSILSLVLITTAVTYAFFTYTKEGTTENTIKSGSITFLYDELNQQGNSIAITDALPLSDTAGKAQTNYFNFKIVSTSANTNTIPYDITVRKKDGSANIDQYIKIYLAKIDNYNTAVADEDEVALDTYTNYQTKSINNHTDKLIYSSKVPASNETYTQFYRLKMWLDESFNLTGEAQTFTLTVNVYANGHLLDANSTVATVNSVSVGGNALTVTSTENGIDYYEATLPEGTTETTLSVDTGDYTDVRITKTQSDYSTPIAMTGEITRLSQTLSKRVSLTDGANYFRIVATSEDGLDSKEMHAMIKVMKTVVLKNAIIDSENTIYTNPTLTRKSGNCTYNDTTKKYTCVDYDPSGLYSSTDTNSGETVYYYRGNVTNNYVRFGVTDK